MGKIASGIMYAILWVLSKFGVGMDIDKEDNPPK